MSTEPDPWDQDTDTGPRFLVSGAPTGRFPKGYSGEPALAMRQEPECLDKDDWDRHIGPNVDQRAKARQIERERTVRLLSQEERIKRAVDEANAKRRDVSREVWLLNKMLAKGRKPEMIEKRVQVLERVAYLGRAA